MQPIANWESVGLIFLLASDIVIRLVSNYALLVPNKGAKSKLRGIKQKKIQIIPLNLDLDLLFRTDA